MAARSNIATVEMPKARPLRAASGPLIGAAGGALAGLAASGGNPLGAFVGRGVHLTGGPDDVTGRLVLMREADLSRFVGSDLSPAAPVVRAALPCADPVPCDAARGRLIRAADKMGELLAAVVVIGSGMLLTGFASLH